MARSILAQTCPHCQSTVLPTRRRARVFCSMACRRAHTPAARFWAKVNKSGDCWLWTANSGRRGYGRFGYNGRTQQAHRVAWQLTHGPIKDGLCVCHSCDVPACVNPAHLWLGTQDENVSDRDKKGRHFSPTGERHGSRTQPESRPRGEAHANAKLTTEQVIAIRADTRSLRLVAADYGIGQQTVCKIKKGQSWAHV